MPENKNTQVRLGTTRCSRIAFVIHIRLNNHVEYGQANTVQQHLIFTLVANRSRCENNGALRGAFAKSSAYLERTLPLIDLHQYLAEQP